ncbi:MAG: phage integrase N-terminal SAM-like domain-containing protein, partial [Ignavibacteriaceae bacterium]
MHTQINIPTKSEIVILPQQGNVKTFQKDNPKLLDRVSIDLRIKHYSRKTEESYTSWIKRFILFNNKKHPNEMGKDEIQKFVNYLAIEKHVSASTQNQALQGILYLYKNVL